MLLVGMAWVHAESDEVTINNQLELIQTKLKQLQSKLNQAVGEEANLLNELEQQDQMIGQLGKEIHQLKTQIKTSESNIEQLSVEIDAKNISIASQKKQMAELLRLQIYINHDRTLKMFLLKKNTETAEITHHQIKYLQQKLLSLVKNIAQQITQLKNIKSDLTKQQQTLLNQQVALQHEQEKITKQKSQRALVLQTLRETISQYRNESEQLNQNKSRLNELLNEITELLNDLPKNLGEGPTFPLLKGKLSRPLIGKTLRSYRSLRAGQSYWDGIVIGNQAGQPVKAVAYGRVAFADWLRGYGLLLVVDHDDDYMTLYGHNESLLVEVGDWVQPGDIIATVGNSGSIDSSGLYFEIRRTTDPTNPIPWFKK